MSFNLSLGFHNNDEWDCVDKEFPSLQECVDYIQTFHHNGYHHSLDITINDRKVRRANNQLLDERYNPLWSNSLMEVFTEDNWAMNILMEHVSALTRYNNAFNDTFRPVNTNPASYAQGEL